MTTSFPLSLCWHIFCKTAFRHFNTEGHLQLWPCSVECFRSGTITLWFASYIALRHMKYAIQKLIVILRRKDHRSLCNHLKVHLNIFKCLPFDQTIVLFCYPQSLGPIFQADCQYTSGLNLISFDCLAYIACKRWSALVFRIIDQSSLIVTSYILN